MDPGTPGPGAVPPEHGAPKPGVAPTATDTAHTAAALKLITQALHIPSADMSAEARCAGWRFDTGRDFDGMCAQLVYQGFQGSNFGRAVEIIRAMRAWRPRDGPPPGAHSSWSHPDWTPPSDPASAGAEPDTDTPDDDIPISASALSMLLAAPDIPYPEARPMPPQGRATIFFGFTSNQISCGNRELICYLCKHHMIDCIVTTGGGIEEDLIKCMGPTHMGRFDLPGGELRAGGVNRIGNLLVPNENYVRFEAWLLPLLKQMLVEQRTQGTIWTPSKMIHRFGTAIDNPDSALYWCARHNIPVFCPALTDGAVGDCIYTLTWRDPGLIVDIAEDIRRMNDMALHAVASGVLVLGGGVVKHHIFNANLMRNGSNWAVLVNTASEFDGSDSGARLDEAVSWGKIAAGARCTKVQADASLIFPFLVAATFARGGPRGADAAAGPGAPPDKDGAGESGAGTA